MAFRQGVASVGLAIYISLDLGTAAIWAALVMGKERERWEWEEEGWRVVFKWTEKRWKRLWLLGLPPFPIFFPLFPYNLNWNFWVETCGVSWGILRVCESGRSQEKRLKFTCGFFSEIKLLNSSPSLPQIFWSPTIRGMVLVLSMNWLEQLLDPFSKITRLHLVILN